MGITEIEWLAPDFKLLVPSRLDQRRGRMEEREKRPFFFLFLRFFFLRVSTKTRGMPLPLPLLDFRRQPNIHIRVRQIVVKD